MCMGDDNIAWMSLLHGALLARGFNPGTHVVLEALCVNAHPCTVCNQPVQTQQTSDSLFGVQQNQRVLLLLNQFLFVALLVTTIRTVLCLQECCAALSVGSPFCPCFCLRAWVLSCCRRHRVQRFSGTCACPATISLCFLSAGDEECEEWYFGEGTHEAVLYAQAAADLPETGLVDPHTWAFLLDCDEAAEVRSQVNQACGCDVLAAIRASPNPDAPGSRQAGRPGENAPLAAAAGPSGEGDGQSQGTERSQGDGRSQGTERSQGGEGTSASNGAGASSWPVLVEGDGGRDVRLLQLALGAGGYYCGEDELMWWQFGDGTANALRTFQVRAHPVHQCVSRVGLGLVAWHLCARSLCRQYVQACIH